MLNLKKVILVASVLSLALSACISAAAQQQPEQPAAQQQSAPAQDIQAQIETYVAQTVEAQNQIATSVAQTLEAQASPTPEATFTPLVIPTFTPVVVNTPTSRPRTGGYVKPEYACDIINRRPFDNSQFNRGADFDIKWTIVNTGTKTWPPGVDVHYYSGPIMSTITFAEIPYEMKPGAKFELWMDASAPTEKGFHVMTWVVQGQYCFPYTAIIVK